MKNKFSSITIIMKPTDYCNLRCKYCYHAEKDYVKNIISNVNLKKCFSEVIPYYENVNYIWHGGEPLSLGPDFFQMVVDIQNEINISNTKISNAIQTNGTLLTQEYIDFFKKNNFGIGLSCDGPFNNKLRGGTKELLRGLSLLKNNQLAKSAICIVGNHNVNQLTDIYDWYKLNEMNLKLNYIFNSGEAKVNQHLLLEAESYIYNIKKLFEIWIRDLDCKIQVNPLEEYIHTVLKNERKSCCNTQCLFKWLSVSPNGSIYPCGREYPSEYMLGNINEVRDIREVFKSKKYNNLLRQVSQREAKCKENCDIYLFCRSNCNNDALLEGSIEEIPVFSCDTYKEIIIYIRSRMLEIKNSIFSGDTMYNRFILKEVLNFKV